MGNSTSKKRASGLPRNIDSNDLDKKENGHSSGTSFGNTSTRDFPHVDTNKNNTSSNITPSPEN
ncbi:9782_t:CDS:1, partial [Acaulospora morrowiae]